MEQVWLRSRMQWPRVGNNLGSGSGSSWWSEDISCEADTWSCYCRCLWAGWADCKTHWWFCHLSKWSRICDDNGNLDHDCCTWRRAEHLNKVNINRHHVVHSLWLQDLLVVGDVQPNTSLSWQCTYLFITLIKLSNKTHWTFVTVPRSVVREVPVTSSASLFFTNLMALESPHSHDLYGHLNISHDCGWAWVT